jgi:hypothetical protein
MTLELWETQAESDYVSKDPVKIKKSASEAVRCYTESDSGNVW